MPQAQPAAPRCDLGVTGQRLRRALPPVSPSPAVRAALREVIVSLSATPTPLSPAPPASTPRGG